MSLRVYLKFFNWQGEKFMVQKELPVMALLGRCMWTTISFPQCPSNIIHKTNFKPYHLQKEKLQKLCRTWVALMVQTDWAQEECNLMIHKLIAHQLGSVSLKSSLVQNKKNLHRGKKSYAVRARVGCFLPLRSVRVPERDTWLTCER